MKFRFPYLLLICYIQDVFSITTIETIPPTPDNVLVTGYLGLVVRATFEKTTSTTNCGWRYNGDTTSKTMGGEDVERFGGLQFHIVGIGCVNRTASRQSITCVERKINEATHIITNLTYHQPLTSDLVLAVRCNGGADLIIALPPKTVIDTFSLINIETIPPTTGNMLATGYPGLVVRATFEAKSPTTDCEWFNVGNTTPPIEGEDSERFGSLQFHSTGNGCSNNTTSRQSFTCVEKVINGVTHIVTNLTYLQPLTSDVILAVRCNNGSNLIATLPTKTVKDCTRTFTNGVVVFANTSVYSSTGRFKCNSNGILFHPNGSVSSLPTGTTCLHTAEWIRQEAIQDLQCWRAPETEISKESILNVTEGDNLITTCQYNNVVPHGNLSIIYFNGTAEVIGKGEMFIISSLQLADDKKQISCQAITPYTQLYNDTGRSPNYTINVQYISDRVVAQALCFPYLIKTGIGYLIQSGQVITINCSTDGNPEPQCALSVCLDMNCTNVTNAKNDCLINQTITEDVSFSCLAFNKAGSRLSDAQSITVISKSRSVYVTSTGNLTNTNLIRRKGEELNLTCSIDHADVLNTRFLWKYGSDKPDSNSELNLPSLTPSDGGNYTCFTQDDFGNFNTTIYVDVLYAPILNTPISCIWKVNENGICEIKFISNPNSSFVSVTKNSTGFGIYNLFEDKVELFSNPKFEQVFVFKSPQVTQDDAGTYVLNLNSSVPPHNHEIMFDIFVIDDNNTLVIALSASGGTCLLVVAVVLLWRCKPWENKGKIKGGSSSHENQAFREDGFDNKSIKDLASPLHATSIHATDGDAVYAAVVKKNKKTTASKEKEEKLNPLYGTTTQANTTEPAYGVVDKTRKKKQKASTEKEDKSNPLYTSTSHTEGVKPTYGVVDQSKKKKSKAAPANKQTTNASSTSLEPTHQSEETYAAIDRNKKKKRATVEKASQSGVIISMSMVSVKEANEEVEHKYNQNNPTEQDSVYAEVRKPKKKKKKRQITQQSEESGGRSSAFRDETLHGTTQQE